MAAEIIHDRDIAGFQYRYELLLHVSAEALVVDRSVEDAGRGGSVAVQRAEEGQGPPVAVRSEAAQALALRPYPRSGDMLILIQVSSMKTSRRRSSPACQHRQR